MGKKPNDDNKESEICEQFGRLTQPDDYYALFDLLQRNQVLRAVLSREAPMI